MISLAGGVPAPQSFPLALMGPLVDTVLTRYWHRALQYDLSEGFPPLQGALPDYLDRHHGITAAADAILATSGSQTVLDVIGKVLCGPGDAVAVEAPTHLGALQSFAPYEPRDVQLETDDGGTIPSSLNFTMADEAAMAEGIGRLGSLLRVRPKATPIDPGRRYCALQSSAQTFRRTSAGNQNLPPGSGHCLNQR